MSGGGSVLPVRIVIVLFLLAAAAGQTGREGLIQCFKGLDPVVGKGLPGWVQPLQQCWSVEEKQTLWNSTQLETDSFDAGNFLLFSSTQSGSCVLKSTGLHLSSNHARCRLDFSARLWGPRAGNSLALSLQTNPIVSDSDLTTKLVWRNASTGVVLDQSKWSRTSVTFQASQLQLMELQFDASTDAFGDSGVALDDVQWNDCCLTECMPDISFDSGWDGWYNGRGAHTTQTGLQPLQWRRWSGATPSRLTGPSADATSTDGKGYYLYMDASDGHAGDTASLLSPILVSKTHTVACQLSFSYHMSGRASGRLMVGIRSSSDWNRTVILHNITGSQTAWQQSGNIEIDRQITHFRIEFIGVKGDGFQGDIAVDRITLDEWCSCPLQQAAVSYQFTPDVVPSDSSITSSSSSNAGYITAVVILCLLSAGLIAFILVKRYIAPKPGPPPVDRGVSNKQIATQKRLSLLGLPIDGDGDQHRMGRKTSSASWKVQTPPASDKLSLETDTIATEHLEVTPSLLDLMETGSDVVLTT